MSCQIAQAAITKQWVRAGKPSKDPAGSIDMFEFDK